MSPLTKAMILAVLATGLAACTGEAGEDGKPGATGSAGPQGPSGDKGDPGADGANGTDGVDGADGADGATGPTGATGATGADGADGVDGVDGADGADGATGPTGATGPQGDTVAPGCLQPCHGFGGIVTQWKESTHYATYIANLGGEEVATWTGATACGNCHAIDGVELRLANNVKTNGVSPPLHTTEGQTNYLDSTSSKLAEANYNGSAHVAVVHCTTCHEVDAANDPHVTGDLYQPGSFPLRVATGPTDQAYIEKSSAAGTYDGTQAGTYNKGNACIWCHKSRKDVTNYITATNNVTSVYWGPHEGPMADVYTGKGGYHFTGLPYQNPYNPSTHQGFTNGCVDCHMKPVAENSDIGNHSFEAELSTCKQAGCHTSATSFDVNGGQTTMKAGLQELRVALNNLGYLTRSAAAPYAALTAGELADKNFALDKTRPINGLTKDQAGALYNYLIIARGGAGGVHNPIYVKELIYDSVFSLTGAPPASIVARP